MRVNCLIVLSAAFVVGGGFEVPWLARERSEDEGDKQLLDVVDVVRLINDLTKRLNAEDETFRTESKLALKEMWTKYGLAKKLDRLSDVLSRREAEGLALGVEMSEGHRWQHDGLDDTSDKRLRSRRSLDGRQPSVQKNVTTVQLLANTWRRFVRPIYAVLRSVEQLERAMQEAEVEACERASAMLRINLKLKMDDVARWFKQLDDQLNQMLKMKSNPDVKRRKRAISSTVNGILSVAMSDDSIGRRATSDVLGRLWKKFVRPVERMTKAVSRMEERVRERRCGKLIESVERRLIESVERRLIGALNDGLVSMSGIASKFNQLKRLNGVEDAIVNVTNCFDIQQMTNDKSQLKNGIYKVWLMGNEFNVYCDFSSHGGGWTVIHRRDLFPGRQENFSRYWSDYKIGFGNLETEFWLGNDAIHALTTAPTTLLVELEDFEANYAFAFYDVFQVASEEQLYRLRVSGYHGNATDSFGVHNGRGFSTKDRLMATEEACCSCANHFDGGWWFNSCFEAFLNGPYFDVSQDNGYFKGIIWELWKGDYSLKAAQMKIRPTDQELIKEPEDP